MSNASDWSARLKAFHEKQLERPRRVYRVGKTKMVVTGGQTACTAGAAVAAVSADFSTWGFWVAVIAGFAGGKYIFPVPRSSVASRYASQAVVKKSPGELDRLSPADIRAYQFNVQFTDKGASPSVLGTEEALGRQLDAVRSVSLAAGVDAGVLADLSLAEVAEYGRTAARYDLLKRRWLTYEVDPQKQFDYPAMSDTTVPTTAAMIRAMRDAERERSSGNPAAYRTAVDRFSQALQAAELAAGVP